MSQRVSRKGSAARNTPQPDESTSTTNSEKSRRLGTLSPTRFSRIQEKHELQNLNNRLAAYIDRVKYLETENSKLTKELHSSQEVTTREVTNVKVLFESEIEDLRNALDREAKEKSRLELENRRKILEFEELKTKFDRATKELKEATPYIARFNELNSKFGQTLIDNKNLKDSNKKLTKELATEKKTVKDVQKTLEEEILQRVAAENKLQSLRENFKFKEEVHKQQLNDTRTSCRTETVTEVDGRLIKEYEDKLQLELQTLRQQAEEDVKRNKKEISELFDSKFQNLENELQRKKKAMELAQEDINAANSRITELTQQINDLLASNNDLLRKMTDLERLKESQRTKYISEIQGLDQQLTAMQDDMSQKVQEYQDLMDIKVALDMEISAYRKLLESEEKRLSITPNTSVVGSPRGKKRKLFQRDTTEYEFSNIITASSTSDIEISEVCPEGQFVKLYNKGSKEVSLSGYELVRTTAGDNVSTVYKFHRTLKLGAGNWLTIWSSTATNQVHEPNAGSIIMNTQVWVIGDLMATILLNPDGQEVATHELKKGQVSHSRTNDGYSEYERELFHQPGDPQTGDKCVVM
ncbi:Intermediate filament protein,Lamin Tail Domain,Intermediate filament protein, conserved site [Cinara cedri]|uniref:Intermediate filament protein,Lamin Tail Domain,Intermediate filament protein, conserved site n=1 Tax=Cinara cedri TaxID=506608 RepID=A0A5E4MP49_9HEMI|nr:Intermediate filament protein,Lamin Tail Domain,Intermediate filament protein, conserved site [Cinara cedri]